MGRAQDPDAKINYRAQSLKELEKLEQKVVLLNEMLDNVDGERREKWAAGDVYDVGYHGPTLDFPPPSNTHILSHLASCCTTFIRSTEDTEMDLGCRIG